MNMNNYLDTNENIVCEGRVSKAPLLFPFTITAICLVLVISGFISDNLTLKILAVTFSIVFLILSLRDLEYCLSTRAYITNKRVLMTTGWLRRMISEMPLIKVSGVSFDQSLFGRIFGYSTTIIESSANVSGVRIKWFENAFEFKKYIQWQLEQVQNGQMNTVQSVPMPTNTENR